MAYRFDHVVYRFDHYELDTHCQELRHRGVLVKVEPQVFRVLAYLVQHRQRVVTKQELAEQLWPQSFVRDEALARCLRLGRKALGDNGHDQQFIRTMYGNGYRFVATVEEAELPVVSSPGQIASPPLTGAGSNGKTIPLLPPGFPLSPAEHLQTVPSSLLAKPSLPSCPGSSQAPQSTVGLCPSCATHLPAVGVSCRGTTPADSHHESPQGLLVTPPPEPWLTEKPSMATEWKLATALACSMHNLATLGERLGPEMQRNLLYEFFTFAQYQVQQYGGSIQYVTDEGFLALFGVPVPYEDHAYRALHVAMTLQRHLQKSSLVWRPLPGETVALRIGLHTGRVVGEQIGNEPRRTYLALGDTTRLAVALQQGATPGVICVSAATAGQVHNAVRLEALAPAYAPGEPPLPVYTVRAARARRAAIAWHVTRPLRPFVGRQWELAGLHMALEWAMRGHGQVVGIVSEPGMGKSRLLYEFRRSLGGRGISYLEGHCSPYHTLPHYGPVRQIICQLCRIRERDPLEVRTQKLRRVLAALGLDSDRHAQCLMQLLGMQPGMALLAGCNPEEATLQALELLHQICLKGSQQQALVVAVENLHWIDPASQKFCDMLLTLLAGARIVLLTTYRLDYTPQWLATSHITPLRLKPLTYEESLRLVNAVDGATALPPQTVQEIVSMANGNPLFLGELTRSARDREAGADPGAAVPIPDAVQNVLMTRLGRLPETQRRLLQTAAVLGTSWPLHLLEAIWDGPEPLAPLLWELQQHAWLQSIATSEPRYAFRDRLMREVAYNSLLLARRQALQAEVAHVLHSTL